MSPSARNLLNFVVFQAAWFACVVGAARGHATAGTLAVAAAVALHLWLAPRREPELWLVGCVVAIGLVWDSLLVVAGLASYPTGTFAPGLAPHWILAMWALFATALNLSLGWLKGRPILAALLGAVGGPLAYFAGYRLGAIEAPQLGTLLLAQAAGWAVLMPLLCALAARANGFAPATTLPTATRPTVPAVAMAAGARDV
jgi:hypothetical protein